MNNIYTTTVVVIIVCIIAVMPTLIREMRKRIAAKRRMQIYERMILYFEHRWELDRNLGFCYALLHVTNGSIRIEEMTELMSYEPEKPYKHDSDYWFNPRDRSIRRNILRNCIKEIKYKNKCLTF